MSAVQSHPLHPPQERATDLFRIYNHYRVVIGLILMGAMFWNPDQGPGSYRAPELFQWIAGAYLAIHIFIGLLMLARFQPDHKQITASLVIDILLLMLLTYASTGLVSGYPNLVAISVAAGNILLRSRLGTLMAAVAALGIIAVTALLISQGKSDGDHIIRSGLFGILYFITAFLVQSISRRLHASEHLARLRARNIAELEALNHQIIQRMRTGIIVADEQGRVRLINEAAYDLLHGLEFTTPMKALPLEMQERLYQWRAQPGMRMAPLRANRDRAPVQVNFAAMEKDGLREVLIFLEDTSKITQQAQQMKLASLGRLTAGIAHEIRNPLGAISHASQLLLESDSLTPADRRMGEIILRHSRRMNTIIENVLQLSRRKQPAAELLDLNTWLRHYFDDQTATAGTPPQILFRPDLSAPSAYFDPSQLAQVMTNLITNGLRYSEQRIGMARVHVTTGINDQGQAYIDVADEGPGIDPEILEHLFEPFFTTDKQGTGLGLYISRELCEANQAQLECMSHREGDTRFRITFAHANSMM